MFRFTTIFAILFVAGFTVLLVATNVRWAFNSVEFYELGFRRHDVAATTGLSDEQLSSAARQIRDYFNSQDEPLEVLIIFDGTTQTLYDDRETVHMRDVKELVRRVYRVQEGTFLYLALFATLGFLILGNDFAGRLRSLLVRGSFLTVALVGLAGLAALVDFGPLFVLFHEMSFSNDFWQLDPADSYLVRMFPQGFWLEAMLIIGVASMAESAAVVLLLTVMRWWQLWRLRVAQRKAPQYV